VIQQLIEKSRLKGERSER